MVWCCKWEPNLIVDASCDCSTYRDVGRPMFWWGDVINRLFRIHFNLCWKSVPIELFKDRMEAFVTFITLK